MSSKIRYISELDQIANNMWDIMACVYTIEDMFAVYADGDYMMGGKNANSHGMSIHFPRIDGEHANLYIAMPSYLGGRFRCCGIKWHGPNVKNSVSTCIGKAETKFTLILNDPDTGEQKAIIPANLLTIYRTAAVSVCAAKYLSVSNPLELAIVGPGKINTKVAEGILKLYPSIEVISVSGHSQRGNESFKNKIKKQFPKVKIRIADSLECAVKNADIVSVNCGFEFDDIHEMPIFRNGWIKENALVISMSFIKIPNSIIYSSSIKVTDSKKMYMSYVEELGMPSYSHLSILGNSIADAICMKKIREEDVIDISDIITNKVSVKEMNGIRLFAMGGLGIEDIAIGAELLKNAEENNIGLILEN